MPDAKRLSEIANLLSALADSDLLYAAEDVGGGSFNSAAITGGTLKAVLAALFEREQFSLDINDVLNGYVTLSRTPLSVDTVSLKLKGGGSSIYGIDYTVSGDQVTWTSLALEPILAIGDVLEISYL